MVQDGSERFRIVQDGSERFRIVQDGSRWFRIIMGSFAIGKDGFLMFKRILRG